MAKVDLDNTKQSKQIADLRNNLEKFGWTIVEEIERKFRGVPRWELGDEMPNLIYSWLIQRNPIYPPLKLDFIAWWDYMTYETEINNCSECMVQDTEIQFYFDKDKSLSNQNNKKEWENKLLNFLKQLNEIEGNI